MQISLLLSSALLLSNVQAAVYYFWVAHNSTEPSVDYKRFGTTPDGHVAIDTGNAFRTFMSGGDGPGYLQVERSSKYPSENDDHSVSIGDKPDTPLSYRVHGANKFVVCLDNNWLYTEVVPSCSNYVWATILYDYPSPTPAPGHAPPPPGYGSE